MAAIRYFRVPIQVTDWHRTFFCETDSALFDLHYHWMYAARLQDSLQDALNEFRQDFIRHHDLKSRNMALNCVESTVVEWMEVQEARPSNQPTPYFQPP
ncbi:MAG: hypothetical protein KatS3mg105_3398 [Gemmatales bacterium]|nr:MAG: hypothetical protein KatS3mg105_3398 [Gemmatales bacterium]